MFFLPNGLYMKSIDSLDCWQYGLSSSGRIKDIMPLDACLVFGCHISLYELDHVFYYSVWSLLHELVVGFGGSVDRLPTLLNFPRLVFCKIVIVDSLEFGSSYIIILV